VGQFATADDLATLLRASFDASQEEAADLLLAGVTGAMQRAAGGQQIALVSNDTVTLQGTWDRELILPQWPVVSVSAVSVNGGPVAAGTWFLTGTGKLYRGYLPVFNGPSDWGGDLYLSSWLGPTAAVVVTYTHGIDPVPPDIKLMCLTAASRAFLNPEGITGETIGNYSYTMQVDPGGAGTLLTESDQAALAEYSRHR